MSGVPQQLLTAAIENEIYRKKTKLTFKISGYVLNTFIGSWILLKSCRAQVIFPAT